MERIAPPKTFIKANIEFQLDGKTYQFQGERISVFGASGLAVPSVMPFDLVGKKIEVDLHVLCTAHYRITTPAMLTCESSIEGVSLGMRFILSQQHRLRLSASIHDEGFYPKEYSRKFPRIPATDEIPHMPLRAIVKTTRGALIALDIADMSPNGILLYSENPRVDEFPPDTEIQVQVEPRGEQFRPFEFTGLVCRVMRDVSLRSGNIRRYLGIQFLEVDPLEKRAFADILRAVLEKLKT